ncbi:hypothetical protein [Hymenobacter lapidiphilus]|uniref:hypothetical protein n=1 Tax=Hymenobacter sp. CCM 8763 TaxID=2303334 RepID=UPI001A912837|nr:hypothetical protein [Hymenobacter sp. CCM 8763]
MGATFLPTGVQRQQAAEQKASIFTFALYPDLLALPHLINMSNLPHTHERLDRPSQSPGLIRYFTLFMAVLYMALGISLWLVPAGMLRLDETARQLLAGVFVFYGIIRFVRTYQQYFKKNRHEA